MEKRQSGDSLSKHLDPWGSLGTPTRYSMNQVLGKILGELIPPDPINIADIGCGDGIYAHVLRELGAKGTYLGIDIESSPYWSDLEATGPLSIGFQVIDAHRLGELGAEFDAAIAIMSFEHVEDVHEVLRQLSSILRADGWLVVAVPSPLGRFLWGKNHAVKWFTPLSLKTSADGTALDVERITPIGGPVGFPLHLLWWQATLALSRLMRMISLITDKVLGRVPATNESFSDLGSRIQFAHLNSAAGRALHQSLIRLVTHLDRLASWPTTAWVAVFRRR